MQNIVINSIKSCKDTIINRKNSFEIYGYDFMVDENYNVWLLEVNSSPSMEYSTVFIFILCYFIFFFFGNKLIYTLECNC
jgi:hypothetical protein